MPFGTNRTSYFVSLGKAGRAENTRPELFWGQRGGVSRRARMGAAAEAPSRARFAGLGRALHGFLAQYLLPLAVSLLVFDVTPTVTQRSLETRRQVPSSDSSPGFVQVDRAAGDCFVRFRSSSIWDRVTAS